MNHVAERLGLCGIMAAAAAIDADAKLSDERREDFRVAAENIDELAKTPEGNAALMRLLAAYLNQGFKAHGRLHQLSGDGSCVEYHYFAAGKERDAVILLATG